MKKLKTFAEVTMPYILSQVWVFVRVYFWTAVFIVFAIGLVWVWTWATGYHLEVTRTISPLGR